jgi:hypothetical protein
MAMLEISLAHAPRRAEDHEASCGAHTHESEAEMFGATVVTVCSRVNHSTGEGSHASIGTTGATLFDTACTEVTCPWNRGS